MKSTKKNTPRNKNKISSLPVPIVSLTDMEENLLKELKKLKSLKRFNINEYSDKCNIARSTTRSRLIKLDRIGLAYYKPKERLGFTKILKTGEIYLENIEKIRDESSRKGGRNTAKKDEISSHWRKFSFSIENMKNFRDTKLNWIDCTWKWNKGMKNWNELIISFNDATIIVKTKTLVIELKDIVSGNTNEVDSHGLRRMMEYVELLNSLGIELGEVSIERGHWARVDSLLADIIYKKIGEKYYLEKDGKKLFWIDFSPDKNGNRKKEDEVPTKEARKNLDHNIDQQLSRKFNFDKIDLNSMEISDVRELLGLVTVNSLKTSNNLDKIADIEKMKIEREMEKNRLRLIEEEKNNLRSEKIDCGNIIPNYIN